jgi:hypothetical protein
MRHPPNVHPAEQFTIDGVITKTNKCFAIVCSPAKQNTEAHKPVTLTKIPATQLTIHC